ncbi:hypothetical protein GQX74_002317 [Glossina fuscipes]|nr:hypothetical protein GQX74_002317 [Glossina fuscipes]
MNESDRLKRWVITERAPSNCEGDNNEKQKPEPLKLAKFIIKVKTKNKRDPRSSLPHYTVTSNFEPTTKFIISASDVSKGKTLLKDIRIDPSLLSLETEELNSDISKIPPL